MAQAPDTSAPPNSGAQPDTSAAPDTSAPPNSGAQPDTSVAPVSSTIGSWTVTNTGYVSTAMPTQQSIVTESAQITPAGGGAPVTVSASIELNYYQSDFMASTLALIAPSPRPSIPISVLADGVQVYSCDLSMVYGESLVSIFKSDDLQGLLPVQNLKVVSGDVVIYEVNLASTQMALDAMTQQSDAYLASHPIQPPSEPNCFLTTACVELIGLDDDCFELSTLRRFRDTAMARTPERGRMVEDYYRLAPALLAEIRRRGHQRKLVRLHFTRVLPCAVAAWLGFDGAAIRIYRAMIARLIADYQPSSPSRRAVAAAP
jgi:hypothetical protein